MIRLPLAELSEGPRLLPASAARYLARVLRAKVGDRVEVFDPRSGDAAAAIVTALERDAVALAIGAVSRSAEVSRPLVLIQGYPKGDKLGDIVRDATELGATAIVPAICARSIARPDASRAGARATRLEAIAREAARQCGRARAPDVLAPTPWSDALALGKAQVTVGIVLWERATIAVGPDLLRAAHTATSFAVAIGPEGGLDDGEIAIAERAGFLVRSLGATILRTETAATAVLAAITLLTSPS